MARPRPLTLAVVGIAALALTGTGIGVATADTRSSSTSDVGELRFSITPNRADLTPLSRATVRGTVYVVADVEAKTTASVTFRLDDRRARGPALRTEKEKPYDLQGGAPDGSANPLDTTTLRDGRHSVLATVRGTDGKRHRLVARFRVRNGTPAPTASPSPSGPAPSVPTPSAPAPSSPPAQSPTVQPGAQTCAALPAFPTRDCTGVPAGTTLTTVAGDYTARKAGEVIDGKRITGDLRVAATGVVVRNSEILGRIMNENDRGSSFSVTDSTVGPASGCASTGEGAVGYHNYTATRVEVRGHGDGFRNGGDNITIQDSFVDLCTIKGAGMHSDGIQGYGGGTNVVVRHNTIDQRHINPGDETSPIFFADHSRGGTVEDNLLIGGGYTLRLHGESGYVATGNRIVNEEWVYGPVSSDCKAVSKWEDNTVVEIDERYRVTKTVRTVACT